MPSGFAQSVSQFFVNLAPVAERKDPNEPGFTIDFIDEAKPSHVVFSTSRLICGEVARLRMGLNLKNVWPA